MKAISVNKFYESIDIYLRDLIYELRNSGINTYFSCEHLKCIECENYMNVDHINLIRKICEKHLKKFVVSEIEFDDYFRRRFIRISWE
jgi:hypothetical protein